MIFYSDHWYQQLKNGPCTTGKNSNASNRFYSNTFLETKPLKAFYEGFYIAEEQQQELEHEEKQEI